MTFCNFKLDQAELNKHWLAKLVYDKHIDPELLKLRLRGMLTQEQLLYLTKVNYVVVENEVKSELLDLIAYDQSIRDFSSCDQLRGEKRNSCLLNLFAIRDSIDHLNAKVFLSILEKYGIPSENDIGIYLDPEEPASTYNQLFYILGIHFNQTESREEIAKIYKQGLIGGMFSPELYGAVYDQYIERSSYGRKLLNTTIVYTNSKAYNPFVSFEPEFLDSINSNRIEIGLDSFHITQQQVLSDLNCKKSANIIPIHSFPQFEEYGYGLVKASFELEGAKLSERELDIPKLLKDNNCQKRAF